MTSEALATALAHHQAGRFAEAENGYRQILAHDPTNVAAWHLLGRLANRIGQHDSAVECLRQALNIRPNYAAAHCDLGTVLEARGEWDQAVASYRRALALAPDDEEAHFNLGNVLLKQGAIREAEASFRRAIAVDPGLVDARISLGGVLSQKGEMGEASDHFRQALAVAPANARALFGMGFVLQQQGDWQEAIQYYVRAVQSEPNHTDSYFNLGTIFEEVEQHEEAAVYYRRVLDLDPGHVMATNNLGHLMWKMGCLDEAESLLHHALSLDPGCAAAFHNLGIVHGERRAWSASLSYLDRAIELDPNLAQAHLNRAHRWLLHGAFEQGWAEYEWRWKTPTMPMSLFVQPQWKGESLAGKTILIHTEQGVGDTLQFIRYVPIVKQRGASVIVQCRPALKKLLGSCRGIDQLFADGEELPPFNYHSPLMSLPGIVNTRLETIPAEIPYLFADPALVATWRRKLVEAIASRGARDPRGEFLIGINWHGRGGNRIHRERDIPWQMFAPLAKLPGVRVVSLQKGPDPSESSAIALDMIDFGDEMDATSGAFMDTAAIVMNLDLIITSDTAIPHLAGALGAPVWLALKDVPDWRWLLERSDSPWYPTMRLFRQRRSGDWAGVFGEIQAALVQRLASEGKGRG